MKTLFNKYITNRLTVEQLKESRLLAKEDNRDLEDVLYNEWMNHDFDSDPNESDALRYIYDEVLNRIVLHKSSFRSRIWRVMKIASVILLPIFIALSIFLFMGRETISPTLCAVYTRNHEKARVILPDNSVIFLNGNASLNYNAVDFGKVKGGERKIDFSGEGYFDIARKNGIPFTINADGTSVTVKGTKFNLETTQDGNNCQLALIEGAVSVNPKWDKREIELKAGEKILIDNATRSYRIEPLSENDNPTAWKDGALHYNYAPLPVVISQIEQEFNCKVKIPSSHLNEHFTGTIPLHNLPNAIRIIELALDCHLAVN